jgi:hypothetical protein
VHTVTAEAAPAQATAPKLVPEFTFRATLAPPVEIGSGSAGNRTYFQVLGGRAWGARFNAEVLPGGGDWLLIGSDGFSRLDVRAQFRTDDGAAVYVNYEGILQLNEAVGAALASGGSTGFGDQYFRTTPRFETGDERYAWLQQHVFIGQGHIVDGAVEYQVYRVD